MHYFLKLNVVSMLYAFMVVVPLELMLNVYRISRITNLEIGTVTMLIGIIVVIELIAGTILLLFLSKKWMVGRKANFWTVILWIPYFVLFVYLFASMFPISNEGDLPNPAMGLLALGGLIGYPLYIVTINFLSVVRNDKTIRAS
ncbi:hypothetical protein SAMN05216389_101190 [Oceanobacillus limi]|uniref:Uncharacterized protein n=1 Tax=Oceanobacillus limi TaxID=930131 RepID=A0A1H9Y4V5_9BACI|nr:hypothetical protein [Oceanobacillus limi]SES63820.1 hypothetical protein SAMN05216389_101190 [Oceanobacillus limi]